MEAEELPDDVSVRDLFFTPRSALDLPPEEAADLLPAVEEMRGQLDTLSRMLHLRSDSRAPKDTEGDAESSADSDGAEKAESTWREKLWRVPAETRLGAKEVAEAVGQDVSWVHSRTWSGADPMLPHAKHGNDLVFKAGEVRTFLREQEDVIHAVPMESTEAERRDLQAID